MTTTEILAKLVAFPVLGNESNLTILKWIENYLTEHGVTYQLLPDESGKKRLRSARWNDVGN